MDENINELISDLKTYLEYLKGMGIDALPTSGIKAEEPGQSTMITLEEVRKEVRRCMSQAKEGGGYMLSDSNSLHVGCNIDAVLEMYRYAKEIGEY